MKNMKKLIKVAVTLTVLLTGCGHKTMSPVEYIYYMEDAANKARQSVKAGGLNYIIQLSPPEYMVSKELLTDESTYVNYTERLNELKGNVFFQIQIGKERVGESMIEKKQEDTRAESRVMYYASSAANDIGLSVDGQLIAPVAYHFEDNYGLAPYNTILVGFKMPEKYEVITLNFNDRYSNIPLIKASYTEQFIKNLPALSIK
ncbi:hypothetical protein CAP35_01300 [Chitinophagaceae bacterium IBVUCB1]|nr:hypothetical protein CAP35_01300 [Chitinophagaceae bacterium IBVUCB1]